MLKQSMSAITQSMVPPPQSSLPNSSASPHIVSVPPLPDSIFPPHLLPHRPNSWTNSPPLVVSPNHRSLAHRAHPPPSTNVPAPAAIPFAALCRMFVDGDITEEAFWKLK